MKTLKIGMLALLMVIANFVWAQQQGGRTPEERATKQSKELTQKLGLTADQEKSVYNACLQRAQQNEADRAKYQGDRESMRSARKQSTSTFETSLGQVLTPDQKAKYEQIKQEQQANRQHGGGGRGQGGGEQN